MLRLSDRPGYALFKETLKFLCDLLPYPVYDLGHSSRHGISRSVPIRAPHAHDLVVGEALDIAERPVAF